MCSVVPTTWVLYGLAATLFVATTTLCAAIRHGCNAHHPMCSVVPTTWVLYGLAASQLRDLPLLGVCTT